MKRIVVFLASLMTAACIVRAVNPCIETSRSTNCLQNASVSLAAITWSPAAPSGALYASIQCVGNNITASTTKTVVNASQQVTIHYSNCPDDVLPATSVAPTTTDTYTVSGVVAQSGSGLSATFTSSTPGDGNVRFNVDATMENTPCTVNSPVTVSGTYAFFKVEMITPAGDPVNAAVQSGDGQNEFTYSTANPGVLTINLKAKVTPGGIANQIKDQCLFTVDAIAGSTLAWDAANPGGKPAASGDNLLATVTFTTLPGNSTDFGSKKAAVYFNAQKQDEESYEVFYPKVQKNHPSTSSNADWPNWMFYWLQSVTPLGSPAPTFTYGTSSGFTPGTTQISLSDGDAGAYSAPYVTPTLYGIDNFAWTVIHESQHYKDWCDLWSNNYTDWFNNHKGNGGPGDDKDGDRISNSTEDVNLNGTYDSGDLYDWQNYNTPTPGRPSSILNDFEDWNCQRHTAARGDHSKDWGDPGMQHKTKDKYDD